MSGHSKWNNIKRKKEKADGAKAKIFTKIGRELAVAVKEGGSADPAANSRLRDAIAKAKAANVPNDNIDRIIKKAAGEGSNDNYENVTYEGEVPYEKNGCVVRPGDKVKSVHIPSSGEPFDQAARLASYKKAYQFFKEELQGGPLVCVCGSWLLYPPYRGILSPTSNVVSFAGDWDILSSQESEEFHDAWRVFGAASKLPPEQWPEDTSMRRAYKKWILEGHKAGSGFGVLLFDGEKILNQ